MESLAPDAFEIELRDDDSRTYGMPALRADRLMVLWYQPAPAA